MLFEKQKQNLFFWNWYKQNQQISKTIWFQENGSDLKNNLKDFCFQNGVQNIDITENGKNVNKQKKQYQKNKYNKDFELNLNAFHESIPEYQKKQKNEPEYTEHTKINSPIQLNAEKLNAEKYQKQLQHNMIEQNRTDKQNFFHIEKKQQQKQQYLIQQKKMQQQKEYQTEQHNIAQQKQNNENFKQTRNQKNVVHKNNIQQNKYKKSIWQKEIEKLQSSTNQFDTIATNTATNKLSDFFQQFTENNESVSIWQYPYIFDKNKKQSMLGQQDIFEPNILVLQQYQKKSNQSLFSNNSIWKKQNSKNNKYNENNSNDNTEMIQSIVKNTLEQTQQQKSQQQMTIQNINVDTLFSHITEKLLEQRERSIRKNHSKI